MRRRSPPILIDHACEKSKAQNSSFNYYVNQLMDYKFLLHHQIKPTHLQQERLQ